MKPEYKNQKETNKNKTDQAGQALIEALAGSFCLLILIGSFAYVLILAGSRLILDNEVDRFVICLASEKNRNCQIESQKRLKLSAPWMKIQDYTGHYRFDSSQFAKAEARLIAVTRFQTLKWNQKGNIEWSPIKIEIERSFYEQNMEQEMKRVSRY
ncbi:MAG: hypothetical protein AABZ31_05605 [Bdellovibrionota bacterium]